MKTGFGTFQNHIQPCNCCSALVSMNPWFQKAIVIKLVSQYRRQDGEKERDTADSKYIQEERIEILQTLYVEVRYLPELRQCESAELPYLGHKCISGLLSRLYRNIFTVLLIIRDNNATVWVALHCILVSSQQVIRAQPLEVSQKSQNHRISQVGRDP